MLESLFNKVAGLIATLLKKTPTQVFSCEYSEIFKNSYFYRRPLVLASEISGLYKACRGI